MHSISHGQASSSELLNDEYVGEIGIGRIVRDDACKADLLAAFENPKTERIFNRSLHRSSEIPLAQ
jgi:hypothetical protein